jgi:hypothetical protein
LDRAPAGPSDHSPESGAAEQIGCGKDSKEHDADIRWCPHYLSIPVASLSDYTFEKIFET